MGKGGALFPFLFVSFQFPFLFFSCSFPSMCFSMFLSFSFPSYFSYAIFFAFLGNAEKTYLSHLSVPGNIENIFISSSFSLILMFLAYYLEDFGLLECCVLLNKAGTVATGGSSPVPPPAACWPLASMRGPVDMGRARNHSPPVGHGLGP